jgi:hypothetical protein
VGQDAMVASKHQGEGPLAELLREERRGLA